MIRPRRMKRLELTLLRHDADRIIEYLGRRGVMHLSSEEPAAENTDGGDTARRMAAVIETLTSQAAYLDVALPEEMDDQVGMPGAEDEALSTRIMDRIAALRENELAVMDEKRKLEEALGEAQAFSNLKAPFAELDQLSYLTLRIGRLDPDKRRSLQENLGDRAVVIPLGEGDRVLAAASRKGRFALDTELKNSDFAPLVIPEGFMGVPDELTAGLSQRLGDLDIRLSGLAAEKRQAAAEYGPLLLRLHSSYRMAMAVERLKSRLQATKNALSLSGWVPADTVKSLVADLLRLSGGRLAVRAYDPEERKEIQDGREKVPVSLQHGAFVKGFEGVVFSYGAPLYGTIDPTFFVALSFTLLFGIMFGDMGQGGVLLLLGILAGKRGWRALAGLRAFSVPLRSVGIASMVVGFLDGEVFSNEHLLIRPTRAITGLLTGVPTDRILHLMPEKGNLERLFLFFAFTVGVGVLINSIGLIINIINQCTLRRWEHAFFSKTGLAGALLFWYALFMGVRLALGGTFAWFDAVGLALPATALFLGPALWRLLSRERPVFKDGFLVFLMEGFVELLESVTSYTSNTVSFLRVGAFALSHAVLSFIVFSLADMVSGAGFGGPVFSFLVLLLGNAIIILLEGMIVAIQVVRLQYYEFFSKFFTETGVEFAPFRFRREVQE